MAQSNVALHRHGSTEAFVTAVTARISEQLRLGLRERGRAALVVPGGTTPGPIFDALAREDLAWDKVAVTLSDERWVPVSDPASNEALVRQRLLAGKAKAARLIGLYNGAATPSAGLPAIAAALQDVPLPFDAALLGMGGDGHFASLFPGLRDLAAGLDLDGASPCLASDEPYKGAPRISLSLSLLVRSRVLLIAVKGADKLAALERAKTVSPQELPIVAVLRQSRVPVEIHWTEG